MGEAFSFLLPVTVHLNRDDYIPFDDNGKHVHYRFVSVRPCPSLNRRTDRNRCMCLSGSLMYVFVWESETSWESEDVCECVSVEYTSFNVPPLSTR